MFNMFPKIISPKSKAAFTFVEAIIYIAIGAMVLVGVITFSWRIIGSGVKVDVSAELTQQGHLALERITQSVQGADGIVSGAYGSYPGAVTLDYPGTADITVDTYTASVNVGGQSLTIRKLRLKEGVSAAVDLTSNRVNVTNFVLTNLRRGTEPANLRVALTLQTVSAGQDPQRNRSITLSTSASVRH